MITLRDLGAAEELVTDESNGVARATRGDGAREKSNHLFVAFFERDRLELGDRAAKTKAYWCEGVLADF